MTLHRIASIFRRDLTEAIRDSRVLVAIVIPLFLGLLYNLALQREEPIRPSVTVAYVGSQTTELPDALRARIGDTLTLTFKPVDTPDEVRAMVARKDAAVGVVASSGFDSAVKRGDQASLTVIVPTPPSLVAIYVTAALEPVLRQMAGQPLPAIIKTETSRPAEVSQSVFLRLGPRRYFVVSTVVMLVTMISMMAVPVILSEEREKKTLDALVLIASYPEVILAKALVGIAYIVVSGSILLGLTRLAPANLWVFAGGMGLLSVTLIGFGLLIGAIFNPGQINTWVGFFLLLIVAPAFLVGLPSLPGAVETVLRFIPTGEAARLAVNGMSGRALFPQAWLSTLVIAVWGVLGYGLLLWRLSRRES